MLAVLAFVGRDPTPPLSAEQFAAARALWEESGPANYDLEVRVQGRQAASYRVEVRGGQPQAAWRNGRPLTSRRTFGTWSVPGMFSTMSRDLETLERAAQEGRPPPLILRAAFDPQYGYPARYRRIDRGSPQGADSVAVIWDVTEFRVQPPTDPR
jgi:hypothetical protein